jgi:hypothetical protein
LLYDLRGDWDAARAAYLALDRRLEAAWMLLRAGDEQMQQGQLDQALLRCRQAVETELPAGEDTALLQALAAYRQAELHWRAARPDDSRQALESARTALTAALPTLAAEGQAAVQQALKGLAAARASRRGWPAWRGLAFEDRLRIALIFRA